MKIRINDTYYIDVDERNYTLKEVRVSENGKPYEKALGYFRSVHQALEFYNRHNLAQGEEELTIAEHIEKYKQGLDELIEACKGVS